MKKHPLLFNFILTMAIQIGVYLIEIFEVQIIEPLLQALGVRSEGIMAPTEVVRFFVMRVVLIAAAISAGIIRSKVYFWIPSFLLIFVGFAIYYPDILPRVEKTNMVNLPLIAEHLGYGITWACHCHLLACTCNNRTCCRNIRYFGYSSTCFKTGQDKSFDDRLHRADDPKKQRAAEFSL